MSFNIICRLPSAAFGSDWDGRSGLRPVGGGIVADAAILKARTPKVGKLLDHHGRLGVVASDVGGRMLAGRATGRHSRSLQGAGVSETESERRFEFPSLTMQACRYVLIACRDDLVSLFDDFGFNDSVFRHFAGFEQPAGDAWPVPQGIVRRDSGHWRGEIASALPG
jgi:hypothetical protein